MSENSIQLIDVTGQRPTKNLRVREETIVPRSSGATESKSILSLDLKKINASLYKREITDQSKPIIIDAPQDLQSADKADVYIYAWQQLKEYGLPVVPTVRKIDANHIVQTDLSANGSSVYDSKLDKLESRKVQSNDRHFISVPLDEVKEKAENIAKLASEKGVGLAYDGPFHLVVDSKGKWNLMMLDLGFVAIGKKQRDEFGDLESQNLEKVNSWIGYMQKSQQVVRNNIS